MTNLNRNTPKLLLSFTMIAFGTVGIVRRYIPLPSGFVALSRAVIGSLFLILVMCLKKMPFDKETVKKNLLKLVISGICMGGNWVLLFESFNHTTVATASLCYYMAPIFLIMVSPFIFGEKITIRNACCILVAIVGILMVSGVFEDSAKGKNNALGIVFGLGAAVLYTCVMVISKWVYGVNAYLKTVIQMLSALILLIPYSFIAENISVKAFSPLSIGLLLLLGTFHTGFCYMIYFGNMEKMSAQTLAVLSYIDPVVAVLLSALILKEPITTIGIIGAVFIIGAAISIKEKSK